MRSLLSAPPTDRVGRYPKHRFRVSSLPFTAQPFMFARILPGETLKNFYFESRCVTAPVKSPIIGWKKEYYVFYIRMTDLMLEVAKEMFVDPANSDITASVGAISANVQRTYSPKGGVDWLSKALDRVVETWFRDDGETASSRATAAGDRIVQIREESWLDSLTDKDDVPVGDDVADATTMGDLERLLDAFETMRALSLADMSYEDWLRSNGIAIPNKDEAKPELIGRWGDYQYPSNTINPETGSPSSALSWVFKNGTRDPKFFKEPGFILGVTVSRPKIYFGGQSGYAAAFATRAWDWMPNYLRGMPETQLKRFSVDGGPLGERTTDTDAYFLDMRDELLYGDQFQNVAAAGGDPVTDAANHILALPDQSLNWKYPTEAMIKSFFVSDTGRIQEDGYASLNIKGFEVDYTKATSIASI